MSAKKLQIVYRALQFDINFEFIRLHIKKLKMIFLIRQRETPDM
jgi:hypothetical protein